MHRKKSDSRHQAIINILALLMILYILLRIISSLFSPESHHEKACIRGHCFDIEIASTSQQRAKGLMFRESLADEKGMLFIFEKAERYPFWMKNTFIPLDIIWISEKLKIVHIETAYPCDSICPSIDPGTEAKYVLEINAGSSDNLGFVLGDEVSLVD